MDNAEPEKKRRGGRKSRYGVKLAPVYVRLHPELLAQLKKQAKVRAIEEPDKEWSVSRLIAEDISRLHRFDLTPHES